VLVLRAELAVEPAREIPHGLGHRVLGIVHRRLSGRAVPLDLDRHRVLVATAAQLAGVGGQLQEVAPLRCLQLIRNLVQLGVVMRGNLRR